MTAPVFGLETIDLDLPALVGAFSRRLQDSGLPVSPDRAVGLVRALGLTGQAWAFPRRRLYWTARAVIVTDSGQVRAFNAVFAEVFGAAGMWREIAEDVADVIPATDEHPPEATPPVKRKERDREGTSLGSGPAAGRRLRAADELEIPVPTIASDEELIRTKRFDALDADELARLYALMARLKLTTPRRLTRRRRGARRGVQIDLRRTLRASLRTGGEPVHLARRTRQIQTRRIVLLCDISGSMEPYARAYLQFLTCAVAGGGAASRNEAFVFATRLTRLTRALRAGRPERALAAAAAAAPDWSSGTRIGDALQTFNDRHGRRGMARGAVVVIISDGWERGDPSLVGRELARLSRLAYRIVWVNPRVAAAGFAPRAGGMAAALPYCDALVSGHSLQALEEVADAIGADHQRDHLSQIGWRPSAAASAETDPDAESWASATDWTGALPGSSVAMPSGYGPARGRTTPGLTR